MRIVSVIPPARATSGWITSRLARFTRSRKSPIVCICSPDASYDLQSDALWQDVSKYSDVEQIYSGEIGRLFGVVFVESTEAPVGLGEPATTVVGPAIGNAIFAAKDPVAEIAALRALCTETV